MLSPARFWPGSALVASGTPRYNLKEHCSCPCPSGQSTSSCAELPGCEGWTPSKMGRARTPGPRSKAVWAGGQAVQWQYRIVYVVPVLQRTNVIEQISCQVVILLAHKLALLNFFKRVKQSVSWNLCPTHRVGLNPVTHLAYPIESHGSITPYLYPTPSQLELF